MENGSLGTSSERGNDPFKAVRPLHVAFWINGRKNYLNWRHTGEKRRERRLSAVTTHTVAECMEKVSVQCPMKAMIPDELAQLSAKTGKNPLSYGRISSLLPTDVTSTVTVTVIF